MSKTKVSVSGSPGFLSLLSIVFITLKLTDVIDWSWWLVVLPLYGPIMAAILFLLVWLIVEVSK